jgi:hypothetical protein
MGFALVLLQAILVPIPVPTAPAPVALCQYIDRWRGTNVPISPSTKASDIAHAVAVAKNGSPIGWVIFRRDGGAWYFDGPINGQRVPGSYSKVALDALNEQHAAGNEMGRGQMVPLTSKIELGKLIQSGLQVYSCY